MDFFSVENGIPVLEYKELYLHPEFKKVLTNTYNKGCDGDMSGNGRNLSKKLFRFFYFYANWKSPYFGLGEVERKKQSLISSGLGENYPLQKDEKEALSFYEGVLLLTLPQINTLRTLKEAAVLVDKGSSLLTKKLTEVIDTLNNTSVDDDEQSIQNFNSLSQLYYTSMDKLLTVGEKVEKLMKDINNIESELKKIEKNEKFLRGGSKMSGRMDPK